MHRFTKKSYKEIAEDSGVSMKTIAYRIQQATKLLRKDLADLLTTIIVCIMSIVRLLLNLFFRPQMQKKRTFFKKEYLINQRML